MRRLGTHTNIPGLRSHDYSIRWGFIAFITFENWGSWRSAWFTSHGVVRDASSCTSSSLFSFRFP